MQELEAFEGYLDRVQESSDGPGYYRVRVRNSKLSTKLKMAHRLAASAFVEGVVNHIDCDPSNNRADNLEWLTQTHRSPETLYIPLINNVD